jgi:hypothetical protein
VIYSRARFGQTVQARQAGLSDAAKRRHTAGFSGQAGTGNAVATRDGVAVLAGPPDDIDFPQSHHLYFFLTFTSAELWNSADKYQGSLFMGKRLAN